MEEFLFEIKLVHIIKLYNKYASVTVIPHLLNLILYKILYKLNKYLIVIINIIFIMHINISRKL